LDIKHIQINSHKLSAVYLQWNGEILHQLQWIPPSPPRLTLGASREVIGTFDLLARGKLI